MKKHAIGFLVLQPQMKPLGVSGEVKKKGKQAVSSIEQSLRRDLCEREHEVQF